MEKTDSSSGLLLLQYGADDSDEDTSFNEQDGAAGSDTKSPREKKRRSSGKQNESLSPSRRISEDSVGKQVAALISDDEGEHHIPESRKREHEADSEGEEAVPLKLTMADVSKKMAPAVSPFSNDSRSSFQDSQRSSVSQKKTSKLPMRLVSYGGDDLEEEDDDENRSSDESQEEEEENNNDEDNAANQGSSPASRGLTGMDGDNIQLPPEPAAKCPKDVQDKITELYIKMREQGFDPNTAIQRLTSFRNPSIYEKLVQTHHIDEKGSNFPLHVYNPKMWGKESFYDELDKAQKKDMERREKEKKTKIEFMSGTKKSNPSSDNSGDDKKRKSKWDALPPGLPQAHRSSSGSGGGQNLTSSATGTRATVISAVGTLTKKASFSIINTTGPAK